MVAAVAAWPGLVSTEAASQGRQTITPAFREAIPNIPGKSLVGIVVHYPPGGGTRAHYHPRSSFVTGYVLSGSIRSQVNHGKAQVFRAGEHWTEPPDAYHPISENASATEPASLLAIFVVDTTDAELDRLVTYKRQ
jgi:quercetin dioxygenase-like cupin family protein